MKEKFAWDNVPYLFGHYPIKQIPIILPIICYLLNSNIIFSELLTVQLLHM